MKVYQSVAILGCAALLLCSCATTPGHPRAAKSGAPRSTNAVAAAESPDEEGSEPGASGVGNAEALARYAAGVSDEWNDHPNQAREQFDKSVLADPSNEALGMGLAQQFLRDGKPEKAVELLSKIAQRKEASGLIFAWLARADLQAGKTNAALEASRQAIARQPDTIAGYESQIEVLTKIGKGAEAVKTLNRAARHIGNKPQDLVALADLYATQLKASDKDTAARARAIALLDRAAAMGNLSMGLRQHIGDIYGRLGETKKATEILAKLVDEAGDTAEAAMVRAALRERLGQMYLDSHDWTNAAKQFKAIVRDDPAHFPEAWYYLGIIAHSDGKLADAADDFANALRADSHLEQAYYRLALVLADMNHGDEAVQILNQARTRFPNSFDCEFFTGLVHNQLKDYAEAVRHFTQAEVMAKVNSPARLDQQFYFQIGAACERNHQYQQAEEYLQKSVNLAPDNAEALNYLGFMWADRGEHLAKARNYIEKAVKMEPKNGAFLDSMGWVLFKQNQAQEALPWLLKAVEYSPEPDATILDHLGDIYIALHQPGKALEAWKKSLSIEPNNDVKKKLLTLDAGAT